MSLAPGWLRAVADANPLEHVVVGVRALFHGHAGGTAAWALVITVALVLIRCGVGVRTFNRESA